MDSNNITYINKVLSKFGRATILPAFLRNATEEEIRLKMLNPLFLSYCRRFEGYFWSYVEQRDITKLNEMIDLLPNYYERMIDLYFGEDQCKWDKDSMFGCWVESLINACADGLLPIIRIVTEKSKCKKLHLKLLFVAAAHGQDEIVKYLFEKDGLVIDHTQAIQLLFTAQFNNRHIIEYLIGKICLGETKQINCNNVIKYLTEKISSKEMGKIIVDYERLYGETFELLYQWYLLELTIEPNVDGCFTIIELCILNGVIVTQYETDKIEKIRRFWRYNKNGPMIKIIEIFQN